MEEKKAAYFLEWKAAVGRKMSSWSEISGLKSEIDRKNSEIHLQLQDVENLKTAAGELAYSSWKEGSLKQADFDMLFGDVRKKEESIDALEASKLLLESQLQHAKKQSEPKKPAQENCPYSCPVCGAEYKTAANFCRRCGAGLMAAETETETEAETETETETETEIGA